MNKFRAGLRQCPRDGQGRGNFYFRGLWRVQFALMNRTNGTLAMMLVGIVVDSVMEAATRRKQRQDKHQNGHRPGH